MREHIQRFAEQLEESLAITQNYRIETDRQFSNVVICGLGGSGIGGEIIKTWAMNATSLPIEVCHSYTLPNYVSEKTLVIACSYSGNTEETLSALEEAISKNAFIVGVSSGGKLTERLKGIDAPCVNIPGGLPPRAALAYPLLQLATILEQLNIAQLNVQSEIKNSIAYLKTNQAKLIETATQLLNSLGTKTLLFYGEDKLDPILLRACQQINENSKELAFYNVVPEMNHNEIVGWAEKRDDLMVVSLRSNLELTRNGHRLDFIERVISKKAQVESIQINQGSFILQTMTAIHILDWLSLLIAEKKEIDVVEVHVIDSLKSELAEL